jgi:hypothetical protein
VRRLLSRHTASSAGLQRRGGAVRRLLSRHTASSAGTL